MDSERPSCITLDEAQVQSPPKSACPLHHHALATPSLHLTHCSDRHGVSLARRSIWQKHNPARDSFCASSIHWADWLCCSRSLQLMEGKGSSRINQFNVTLHCHNLSFCFLVGSRSAHIPTVHRRGRKWFERFAEYKISVLWMGEPRSFKNLQPSTQCWVFKFLRKKKYGVSVQGVLCSVFKIAFFPVVFLKACN